MADAGLCSGKPDGRLHPEQPDRKHCRRRRLSLHLDGDSRRHPELPQRQRGFAPGCRFDGKGNGPGRGNGFPGGRRRHLHSRGSGRVGHSPARCLRCLSPARNDRGAPFRHPIPGDCRLTPAEWSPPTQVTHMSIHFASTAQRLNASCFCITLNREALYAAMEHEAGDSTFSARYIRPREHLFSNVPVFHSTRDLTIMTGVVRTIEAASRLPAYQNAVSIWAPEIARFDPGPRGAFMGYDFHLGADGPKLIEVNTNAGGAFLNALLAKAQRACCREVEHAFRLPLVTTVPHFAMRRGSYGPAMHRLTLFTIGSSISRSAVPLTRLF